MVPRWFDGGVSVLLLVLGIIGVLVVADAYRPVRREPWSVFAFIAAWLPGELPIHGIVLCGFFLGVGSQLGALRTTTGQIGASLLVVAALGLVGLTVVGTRVRGLVDQALDTATGGPVVAPDSVDLRPVWVRSWRLVLAVPFRFRSVRRIKDIDYWGDGAHRHRLDVLVRREAPPRAGAPVLLYVHGGAWIMGEKREQGIPMMHELARRGWVCVAINYRLSPKAGWPDHIVDVKRAIAWVREHIGEYGGDPSFLAISGGSAGGHLSSLAALTSHDPTWQPGFEEADTSVSACVPFYGVYDVTNDPEASGRHGGGLTAILGPRVMKATIDERPDIYADASPDQRITPDAPPMFVLQGVNDTLVPVEVARRFVERLRATSRQPVAYVELPCAQHAFDILLSIRSRDTTLGAVRFLEGIRATTPPRTSEVVDTDSAMSAGQEGPDI